MFYVCIYLSFIFFGGGEGGCVELVIINISPHSTGKLNHHSLLFDLQHSALAVSHKADTLFLSQVFLGYPVSGKMTEYNNY